MSNFYNGTVWSRQHRWKLRNWNVNSCWELWLAIFSVNRLMTLKHLILIWNQKKTKNVSCTLIWILPSGGSRPWAKAGVGAGRGGGFVLLALLAFLPRFCDLLFFTQNKEGWVPCAPPLDLPLLPTPPCCQYPISLLANCNILIWKSLLPMAAELVSLSDWRI